VVVNRQGIPLAVTISAANVHDSRMMLETLDAIEPIKGRPRIARRDIESSERLGRHRRVVERTLSWLNRYRRLRIRYERHADMHLAFLHIGCALICWNFINH
jgi:transposase